MEAIALGLHEGKRIRRNHMGLLTPSQQREKKYDLVPRIQKKKRGTSLSYSGTHFSAAAKIIMECKIVITFLEF